MTAVAEISTSSFPQHRYLVVRRSFVKAKDEGNLLSVTRLVKVLSPDIFAGIFADDNIYLQQIL